MNNPEYAKVGGKKYKINTDFRIALECNKIATDDSIGDYERALAIIYKLYGDEGLNETFDIQQQLLRIAKKYLLLGKEYEESDDEPDMDYYEDMDYIEASFMSDYQIDLTEEKMSWYKFNKLLNGLSNSELGNCCILNKIRNIRNTDLSKIKDDEQRENMRKAKEFFELHTTHKYTSEEESEIDKFNREAGLI